MSASAAPERQRLQTRVGTVECEVSGAGAPAIVLFSGAGMTLDSWSRLRDAWDGGGTFVAWNRFGLDRSDPPRREQTGAVIVAALRELLTYVGVDPPYVLVAHSLGGLYANLFARLRPTEVAGVLLAEATHPRDHDLLNADPWQLTRSLSRVQGVAQELFYDNLAAELGSVDLLVQELAAAGPFPDVPLTVVSGGMPPPESLLPRAAWEERQRRQLELARLAPRGRHVVAAGSGHFPQVSEARLVAEELRQLLAQLQPASPL